MNPAALLVEIASALAVAECSSILENTARAMIRWSVRLSFGWAPQGHNRLLQADRELANCRGQIARFCFAFGILAGSVVDWCRKKSGRPGPFGEGGLPKSQLHDAAALLSAGFRDFGEDLRTRSRSHRREFTRLASRLHGLLAVSPQAFTEDGAAAVLRMTATTCELYVEDRDERKALGLAQAALPLAGRFRHHDAALALRRARAQTLLALGHHQRAVELFDDLVHDERIAYGPGDPRTARTQEHYAWAFTHLGLPAESGIRLGTILEWLAPSPGEDALKLHIRCKLNWALGQQGRLNDAMEGYVAVLSGRTHELGPDHPDVLDTRHSMGKLLVRAGRGDEACAVLEPLLRHLARVEGARHPNTLETRKYLAIARALSRPEDAAGRRSSLRELRRVLRLQMKAHGADYPATLETRRLLAGLRDDRRS